MGGGNSFTTGRLLCRSLHILIKSPSFSATKQRIRGFSGTRTIMARRDPSTLSNYDAWITRHTTVNLQVDFVAKRLEGSVELELESLTDKASKEIVLDTTALKVTSVKVDTASSEWEIKEEVAPLGSPLVVSVPDGVAKGTRVSLEIALETTAGCTGLQWMEPAQTGNKKHPYVYSQCQAILARSIFPCQDTPDVKSTFTFNIKSPLPVVASGVPAAASKDGEPQGAGGVRLFRFEQKVPIPSYLFALASGDLATAPIGRHSVVVAGPEIIKEAQWEFEDDMDKFLDVAQKLVYDYQWGEYNVLVLPPSFSYGGEAVPFSVPYLRLTDQQADSGKCRNGKPNLHLRNTYCSQR
jgi:leukotriene-A4 hydrolase